MAQITPFAIEGPEFLIDFTPLWSRHYSLGEQANTTPF